MRGVVFDTSIWIEYLRGNPDVFLTCQELLEDNRVFGLELIFAELLQGAKGKREVETIIQLANLIPSLDEPYRIIESGLLSQKENLVNQGVGLIDVVIFHAVAKNELKLWTLDKKLRRVMGYDLLF
ncbi:PIN domain-containing protein [Belliella kenyensis]|uniref:PIN domain-containing protein n=1 Tax=Belliella kenyensis TaxID=1472724 RepID=A0ABV8ENX1_9BACT|nr:PIN domain-containing protein [Belliella kenyensis]MCH7402106.1 PIN domain-containing protein [Belliella kenyensis]MDN3601548.1 PIN domain-containing protein [Belliella kenyensis]